VVRQERIGRFHFDRTTTSRRLPQDHLLNFNKIGRREMTAKSSRSAIALCGTSLVVARRLEPVALAAFRSQHIRLLSFCERKNQHQQHDNELLLGYLLGQAGTGVTLSRYPPPRAASKPNTLRHASLSLTSPDTDEEFPALEVLYCCFSGNYSPMSRHAHVHMAGPQQMARRQYVLNSHKRVLPRRCLAEADLVLGRFPELRSSL
jgi:hypothetical protein